MSNERLTKWTDKGAVLKLDDPQNEAEARQQLMSKFKTAINKLATLEDKIENYTLIELPCDTLTTVYVIQKHNEIYYDIFVDEIQSFTSKGMLLICNCRNCKCSRYDYNHTWFTDKAKAEEKLKELRRKQIVGLCRDLNYIDNKIAYYEVTMTNKSLVACLEKDRQRIKEEIQKLHPTIKKGN